MASPSRFLLALILVGCSSASADDSQGSSQDVTVGARWTSPLAMGVYDSQDSVLSLFPDGTRQHAHLAMDITKGKGCDGLIDVSNGRARLDATAGTCVLDLASRSGGVGATGQNDDRDVNMTFARRSADALVGDYVGDYARFVVEASTENDDATSSLRFSIYMGDQSVEHVVGKARAPGAAETGRTYSASVNGCNMWINLHRSNGNFYFGYATADLDTDTCLLRGMPIFMPKS
jgi:hypothetical protein